MLDEMKYIESELLPMLRERAQKHEASAQKQLRQWKHEKGVCSLLLHVTDAEEAKRLPNYDNYDIHYDDEKMFVSQLKGALSAALADGDAVPSVRANVGCGAINTLYGGLKQEFFHDKMPWLLKHLTAEEVMEIAEEQISESEEFARGLQQMRYMKKMLEGTGIELYPMDLQGPMNSSMPYMMSPSWFTRRFRFPLPRASMPWKRTLKSLRPRTMCATITVWRFRRTSP